MRSLSGQVVVVTGASQGGGRGIASVLGEGGAIVIASLFERVRQEQGRLDLLVNNAWGGYEDYAHHGGGASIFDAVFWEQPIARWDKIWRADYRTAKLAINYLTFGMAHDIYKRGGLPIPVIGLAMGWMRTEAVMENFRQGLRRPEGLAQTDSVELGGRAVPALVNDPMILEKTGKILRVQDLAQEYGFKDVEG